MVIAVDYDELIDSMIIKAEGNVGREEICGLRDKILEHPCFRMDINQLFDATECRLELSTEDLEYIAFYYSQKSSELGNNRKLALLVAKDVDYGMMRQYEVFFDSGPTVLVQAFRDPSKAKYWLKN